MGRVPTPPVDVRDQAAIPGLIWRVASRTHPNNQSKNRHGGRLHGRRSEGSHFADGIMPRPCYSTIIEHSADHVWPAIRDFGNYHWAGVVAETTIEDGKSGDAVGCVRRIQTNGGLMRQRLLAHSDHERFYVYTLCEPSPLPLRDYVATIRVIPVTDGDRALVQWSAVFDCLGDEDVKWHAHFMNSFHSWLTALRRHLA